MTKTVQQNGCVESLQHHHSAILQKAFVAVQYQLWLSTSQTSAATRILHNHLVQQAVLLLLLPLLLLLLLLTHSWGSQSVSLRARSSSSKSSSALTTLVT